MTLGLKWERRLKVVAGTIWMVIVLTCVLFPTYWIVLASFKHPKDLAVRIPIFWTNEPTLISYRGLFTQPFLHFEKLTFNSLTIALGATLLSVVIATFAGLALARLRFPGRQRLGMAVFFAYLVPPALLFIPLYVMMATVKLVDSRFGLILVYSSFTVPFGVWMLRGYFHNIPVELEECAMIDGCTRVGAWVRIVLPLASPWHRRRRHLRLHAGLERVLLRLHPDRDRQSADHADRTCQLHPARRLPLGRAQRRRPAHGHPRRRAILPGPALRRRRPYRRGGQGLTRHNQHINSGFPPAAAASSVSRQYFPSE